MLSDMMTSQHELRPRAPFDFAQTLAFLGTFPAMMGEQALEGALTKAVRVAGETVVFTVADVGTPAAPRLQVTLHGRRLDPEVVAAALDRVRFFLGTEDDVGELDRLMRADPAARPVAERLHGLHQVKLMTPFENAVWAVLGQRCALAQARAMKQRLIERFGEALRVDGRWHAAFPDAAWLARVPAPELAALLGNPVKARRISAVARAFAAVDERWLREGDYDDVRAWLLAIEGIGPWSAAFVMLRGLGRVERLDGAEEALAPQVARVYRQPGLDVGGLRSLAARYGALQGYWAHYLMVGSGMTR